MTVTNLGVDQIIQQNSGSFESTSGTVSLPAGTTAGSILILMACIDGDGVTGVGLNNPTGGAGSWAHYMGGGGIASKARVFAWDQRNVAAGETSWTLTTIGGSRQVVWTLIEMSGVGLSLADAYVNRGNLPPEPASSVSTIDGGSMSVTNDCLVACGFAIYAAVSAGATPVVSNYTNGFNELTQTSRANGTQGLTLAAGLKSINDIELAATTADVSPAAFSEGFTLVYYADNAPWVPNYSLICGFEVGTATNLSTTTPLATAGTGLGGVVDAFTGTPEVSAAFKRTGNYALKLSSSAAAENVSWLATKALPNLDIYTSVMFVPFYFDTSLPGSDVDLFSIEAGSSSNAVKVRYRTASQKIGVQVGSGTEQLSDAVVAANKWIAVDLRYDPRTTTHLADWRVDYDSLDASSAPVDQTQASSTGMTAVGMSTVRLGWTGSTTATVYYDDVVYSHFFGAYPIGDTRIVPLLPDVTGTATVTGSAANFKTFTSNGTTATWTSATTIANLRDMPPVIGASSDGLTQVTAATGDFVTIPMETYDCAGNLVSPRAVRWYVPGWAASTSAATIEIWSVDADGNGLFDSGIGNHTFTSTTLVWVCGMQRRAFASFPTFYQLTKARLDALTLNMGVSSDATPDVGIHAILAELAVQPAVTYAVSEGESGAFTLYGRIDAKTQAYVSLLATTPTGVRGMTVLTTVNGVDAAQYIPPNTAVEIPVGADDINGLTAAGISVDPT